MSEQPDAERTTKGVIKVFGRVKQPVVSDPPAAVGEALDTPFLEAGGKRKVVFGRSAVQPAGADRERVLTGAGQSENAEQAALGSVVGYAGQGQTEFAVEAEAEVPAAVSRAIHAAEVLQPLSAVEDSVNQAAYDFEPEAEPERGVPEPTPAVDEVAADRDQGPFSADTADTASAIAEPEPAARERVPIAPTMEHPFAIEVQRLAQQVALITPIPDFVDVPDENPLEGAVTDELLHLLEDKVEEFHWLGYNQVTVQDLWMYFRGQVKRRPKSLHELVNAVLCLQPQEFMNYSMTQAYRHMPADIRELL